MYNNKIDSIMCDYMVHYDQRSGLKNKTAILVDHPIPEIDFNGIC